MIAYCNSSGIFSTIPILLLKGLQKECRYDIIKLGRYNKIGEGGVVNGKEYSFGKT